MSRYRSWGRWLPAVVAAFILGWVALSLVAWPRATGDVTHDGFDPNLLWTGVLGTPTAGQVSLRWLIQKGAIVIPRTSKVERLSENMNVFDFALTPQEMVEVDALAKPAGRVVSVGWAPTWD